MKLRVSSAHYFNLFLSRRHLCETYKHINDRHINMLVGVGNNRSFRRSAVVPQPSSAASTSDAKGLASCKQHKKQIIHSTSKMKTRSEDKHMTAEQHRNLLHSYQRLCEDDAFLLRNEPVAEECRILEPISEFSSHLLRNLKEHHTLNANKHTIKNELLCVHNYDTNKN